MIGNGYWSTGITLRYVDGCWEASLNFYDHGGGYGDSPDLGLVSTVGTLATRRRVGDERAVSAVVDAMKADAERLGIVWRDPTVYMVGDGEHDSETYPPDWQRLVNEQAARIGWQPTYEHRAAT